MLALLAALGCDSSSPCGAAGDCGAAEICINGECLERGSCDGVSCEDDEVCNAGFCMSTALDAGPVPDAGRSPDGGADAGLESDAGQDAGPNGADAGPIGTDAGPVRTDAGPIGTDAGPVATDAGPDAGPPCTCTPGEFLSFSNCGTCGRRERRCASNCRGTTLGSCEDSDTRCSSSAAPYCRNDVCWGGFLVHETGRENQCVDMGNDYITSDGNGTGAFGSLDIQVRGRPGAGWLRENRQTSCGGPWMEGESGTLDASGNDTSDPFVYGASGCDLTVLGRWESRVHITDPGGPDFTLPTTILRYYNSDVSCPSDRDSCTDATSFCGDP